VKVTKERKKVQRHLSRARQEIKAALEKVRDVQFSEENVELLRRQNEALQGMSRLLAAALSGDSDTDLDAELAQLEERRQWGERSGRGSW
jgi:ABC-type phosphate transport system auxiliary subunit